MKMHQSFTASWINNVWLMIYRAIWRIFAFAPVMATAILGVIIPCAIDGTITRSKRSMSLGFKIPYIFILQCIYSPFVLG